jgi:GT2 family glycosyltransferase
MLKKLFPKVEVAEFNKNTGYTGGNNYGIEIALKQKADYIFILNPDVLLENTCLERLVSGAETIKNKGIFGPVLFKDTEKHLVWSAGGFIDPKRFSALLRNTRSQSNKNESLTQCDFVSGTAMLIPCALLQDRLRFHDPYFLYYEDVDLCFAARRLGYPSYTVGNAHAIHLEVSSSLSNATNKEYYLARNHLLFIERHGPIAVKLREFLRLPKSLWEFHAAHKFSAIAGIRDYFLRHYGYFNGK